MSVWDGFRLAIGAGMAGLMFVAFVVLAACVVEKLTEKKGEK